MTGFIVVLFVCSDLMFVSRVQQAARRQAVELTTRSSLSAATQWLNSSDSVTLQAMVVDLKGVSDLALLATLVAAYQTSSPSDAPAVKCLAFGPHVKVDLLEGAREAGFEVLTQGQFDRSVESIFASLA